MRHSVLTLAFLAGTSVSLLTGCGTGRTGGVRGAGDLTSDDTGNIVGSFGCVEFKDSTYTGYEILFRSIDKKIRGNIVLFTRYVQTDLDWEETSWKGVAFNYAVPPGNYEFYNVLFKVRRWIFAPSEEEFSLTFHVNRGETVYVGEIKCYYGIDDPVSLHAVPLPFGPYFVISGRAERDIPVIRKKFPEIAGHLVRIEIPAASTSRPVDVRSEPLSDVP